MTKFQKIQRFLGLIPFLSMLFVFVVSIIELKRHSAVKSAWVKLLGGLFGILAGVLLLNAVVMTGKNPFLNVLASWLWCALGTLWFVHLQYQCTEQCRKTGVSVAPLKMEIIILVAAITLFFSFLFGFVTWTLTSVMSEHRDKTIADTNGISDFSLQTITLQEIVENSFGGTQVFWSSVHEGNQSDISDRFEDRFDKEVDYDKIKTKAQEFSGIDVVHATKTDFDTVTLTVTSTVPEGNFAIVIVVDNSYYCSVEVGKTKTVKLTDIAGKKVLVKIAGESADYQIEIAREYDN